MSVFQDSRYTITKMVALHLTISLVEKYENRCLMQHNVCFFISQRKEGRTRVSNHVTTSRDPQKTNLVLMNCRLK